MENAQRLAALEADINERCNDVTWITTCIFTLGIFLVLLRPDPTMSVCLFGFYGAHVRSHGAVRSFAFFLLITAVVDVMWIFAYSPLRPIVWETLSQLSRKDQMAVLLTCLGCVYKMHVVHTCTYLVHNFKKREAVIDQMERDAGVREPLLEAEAGQAAAGAAATAAAEAEAAEATTSSGEPLHKESLAAQAGK
jgi:hypothetical protein